ncbi:MAG: hypothetical protein QOI58_936 [Thermoanaerobaculia bacterium]|nr:hypothetical protein [Thermoanaerobaculia bacterium]
MKDGGHDVEPDRVSAVVEGYFRIPAVWIGQAPSDPSELGVNVRQQIACRSSLSCGIEAYAMRNGMFLFDFLSSSIGKVLRVPGFEKPETAPYTLPHAHVVAAAQVEAVSMFRAQIMNVHQACLISSEWIVERRATSMGFPVAAWNTVRSIGIAYPPPDYHDTEDTYALARNVLEGIYAPTFVPGPRRVLETEVVDHSFRMLDHILGLEGGWYIPIVEAAYQSACRSIELRSGESIAVGWTVCEQLVSKEWKDLLSMNHSARGVEANMSSDRRKKLLGRDYTASVMVEMLELHGKLSGPLYNNLESARKARNNWAHDMDAPSSAEVSACQQAIKELLARKGIHLSLQHGFRGAGNAGWPLSIFHEVHGDQIPGFMSEPESN